MGRVMDGCVGGWKDVRMDGGMDGWMDGWLDGQFTDWLIDILTG